MGGFAWVTLATNDSYSLGALVLAHSLKQAGTKQELAVLVTPGVTNAMRAKLATVFNVVKEVNILDSRDETNLRLLKRPELGITFTKLHCWRLTQYDKCVFLDADTLVLQNCDELFDREELSAAPDVGWPDCFNSGVFVYRPSNETFEKLITFALERGSFDGGDQGLLNLYFSDWAHKDITKHLPFIYNMCSTACYSYLPAFKQFGRNAKIIHFIGTTKPWLQYFNTETKQVQPSGEATHLTDVLQLWWNIFCSLIHPQLSPEMAGLAGAFAQLTLGVARSPEQQALDDLLRKQAWEVGNIDYLGRDSFDNIWSKISETLSQGEQKEEVTTAEIEKAVPEKPVEAIEPATDVAEICEKPVVPDTAPIVCQKPVPESIQAEQELVCPKPVAETIEKPVETPQESPAPTESTAVEPQPSILESTKPLEVVPAQPEPVSTEAVPVFSEPPKEQSVPTEPVQPEPVLSEPLIEQSSPVAPTESVKEQPAPVDAEQVKEQPAPIVADQVKEQPAPIVADQVKEQPALVTPEPVKEPVPVASEPVKEPAPVALEPAKESAPVTSETVKEPLPVASEPVKESVPLASEPAKEPLPVASEPVKESVPLASEPVKEATESVKEPSAPLATEQGTPVVPVPTEEVTTVSEKPVTEQAAPVQTESPKEESKPVPVEPIKDQSATESVEAPKAAVVPDPAPKEIVKEPEVPVASEPIKPVSTPIPAEPLKEQPQPAAIATQPAPIKEAEPKTEEQKPVECAKPTKSSKSKKTEPKKPDTQVTEPTPPTTPLVDPQVQQTKEALQVETSIPETPPPTGTTSTPTPPPRKGSGSSKKPSGKSKK